MTISTYNKTIKHNYTISCRFERRSTSLLMFSAPPTSSTQTLVGEQFQIKHKFHCVLLYTFLSLALHLLSRKLHNNFSRCSFSPSNLFSMTSSCSYSYKFPFSLTHSSFQIPIMSTGARVLWSSSRFYRRRNRNDSGTNC